IHNITMLNGRLYMSGWGGNTFIYDVRNIGTQPPVLLGAVDSGNTTHSNWVSSDGKLLVSGRETVGGDLRLFDIADPASPRLLSTINSASLGVQATSSHNPYLVGNLLFASWYQAGLQVIDITDPVHPMHVGSFDTFPGPVSNNNLDGNWGVYPFLG